jgi:D-proline reductase (dithiol) PrdB
MATSMPGGANVSIDPYRFLDFASRQIIKAWVAREAAQPRSIPWTPLARPLAESTVALIATAGVARRADPPFDEEGERRDPWWGDPGYRTIPQGTTEAEVDLHHLHIDRRFGREDLDVVLPMRRLAELAGQGVIGEAADTHYSIMGYQLRPEVLENETAPAIAREMRSRGVDVAALVPT